MNKEEANKCKNYFNGRSKEENKMYAKLSEPTVEYYLHIEGLENTRFYDEHT